MRACSVCLLLAPTVFAVASASSQTRAPAVAPDTSSLPVYTIHDTDKIRVRMGDDAIASRRAGGPQTIYASVDGRLDTGFFADNGGFLLDDYEGVGATAPTALPLHSLRFEGGVTTSGMVAFFVFFNAAGTEQLGGFGFQFPSFGVQEWEFFDPTPETPVLVDESGVLAVVAATIAQNPPTLGVPTTVAWSQSTTVPSLGFNTGSPGASVDGLAPSTVYGFDVTVVPTPGAAGALVAAGGLSLLRRRRGRR